MITKEDITKVANLSRLQLADKEVEVATRNVSGILDHFAEIQKIDTHDTLATDDASGLMNITRTDEAAPETLASQEKIMAMAPETKDGLLKVSAVFEN